jgi:hypothetical protein
VRKIAAAAATIPVILYVFIAAILRKLFPDGAREVPVAQDDRIARNVQASTNPSTIQSWVPLEDSKAQSSKDWRAGPVRGSGDGSVRSLSGASIRGQSTVPHRTVGAYPVQVDPSPVVYDLDPEPALPHANGPRRTLGAGAAQVLAMAVAVALLAAGLMLGLPAKQVAVQTPPSFAPIAPEQGAGRAQGDLPLDVGYQLKFTKPMNQASVQNALTISPQVSVKLQWDATAQTVALVPSTHWDPRTTYVVEVGNTATDQQGLGLAQTINEQFQSGDLTSGSMVATAMVGDLASPATAFQITFTRPVKLLTVQTHLMANPLPMCPPVNGVSALPVNGICVPPSNTPSSSASDAPGAAPSDAPSAAPSDAPSAAPSSAVSLVPVCPVVDGPAPAPVNGVCPSQALDIIGDDPTDVASQVFTATPHTQLVSKSTYAVSFAVGQGSTAATDAAGAALQPISPLQVATLAAPVVSRFKPQDGSLTYDTNQPISVRFSAAMETKSSAAAFSVTADGVAIAGTKSWSDGNTVLVLTPRRSFTVGTTVVATVTSAARAVGGLHIATTYSISFRVAKEPPKPIGYTARAQNSSPWYGSEVYYLRLMNCTRTGGWVTSGGTCSSVTHHTLPAQGPLRLSSGISNNVSRPYAKYMADNRLLSHTLRGTTAHSRLCKAGYCGGGWGENIASPGSTGSGGMISIEIYYQNEYWCRCEHYANIMNGHFGQVGIGVWLSKSVRVAIDFYS